MPLITPPIKNIREVTEPLKEQILKGDVHTIDEMGAWLKPLGYSDTINEAAINFILREFVMSKVPSGSFFYAEMIVELFRPQLEHQTSYFSHQPSLGLYHHRNLIGFIFDAYNRTSEQPFWGISFKVDNALRKCVAYGASCGRVIQAGNFKADYDLEVEMTITIQNESPYTAYNLNVSYLPNDFSKLYTLIDSRENKLQPLEGNGHVDFTLRIMSHYYDVYAFEVDKDIQQIYKIGKEESLLNGSKLVIKYCDAKHKEHIKTEVIN